MPSSVWALLAFAAIGAIPLAGGAQEVTDVDMVHGRADADNRMTVPVQIGDKGSYRFLIDTGSEKTVLSAELATRLALAPLEKRRIVGIAGTDFAHTALLDELGLGRRSFHGLTVLLFESEHIGADGIVGIDSLQRQRVLIDFAQNRMEIGDAKSLGGDSGYEIIVTARRRGGQLIMTNADIDGVRTDVIVDTGSGTSIGNRALQRALRNRGNLSQVVLKSVTGQETIADLGYARKLGIGNVGITNVVIAFTDGPAFAALKLDRRPALMLGMRELRLFKRVVIDFSTSKVMFDLPSGL